MDYLGFHCKGAWNGADRFSVSTPWVLTDLVHHGVHAAGKASGTYGTSLAVDFLRPVFPSTSQHATC
eukprot:symbB.v1.2.008417.t1/scaffold529.1/size191693/2